MRRLSIAPVNLRGFPAIVLAALILFAPAVHAQDDFDPSQYIGQGDAFNCGDFVSQADAQAVLRADPRDPNRLDADRDGVACERNRAPFDLELVER